MIRKIDGEMYSWYEVRLFGRVYRTCGYWRNLALVNLWDNVALKMEIRDMRKGVK